MGGVAIRFVGYSETRMEASMLVTPILIARSRVLIVPTLVMSILLSLEMSSVGLAMFTAAIIRAAIAVMLCFDGTERQ